ncbi:MAG TPA: erythromycin esterase family protein [Sphingomonadaceae bacterium]|nr:erythromycin esterase family protein [Sphingomonadaceae bacterium]
MLAAAALLAACSPGDAQSVRSPAAADATAIAQAARPIAGAPSDYDPLLAAIGDARFVLLGEATHGTHEFYRERARISTRLVRDRGFRAVVIEGDWPDTGRVNRYVRGLGTDRSAEAALGDFADFPRWMWRNAEFRDFVETLRTHNAALPPAQRVGVYGMDVYNLFGAAEAVVAYLEGVDKQAAARARANYRCFAPYRPDPALYGEATRRPRQSCERQAVAVLADVRARPRPADPVAAESLFSALRSAASVVGAEAYNRASFAGTLSWNVRDRLMADTVAEVADHAAALSGTPGTPGKVVVWAHNSHIGDARATDMPLRGELNLGQLMRERFGAATFLLGFTTFDGTVIAADRWDGPHRTHTLHPAMPGSYAALFHQAGLRDALLLLPKGSPQAQALGGERPKREIGVIYARNSEAQSHYMRTRLARQFDAVIHMDRTRALTPLR